jgi:hypothetical protein
MQAEKTKMQPLLTKKKEEKTGQQKQGQSN